MYISLNKRRKIFKRYVQKNSNLLIFPWIFFFSDGDINHLFLSIYFLWGSRLFKLEIWMKNTNKFLPGELVSTSMCVTLKEFRCFVLLFLTSGSLFLFWFQVIILYLAISASPHRVHNVCTFLFFCSFYCSGYPLLSSCHNPTNNLPVKSQWQ